MPLNTFTPNTVIESTKVDDNFAGLADGSLINDDAITPEKLIAGAGTSWAWQSWNPTWANLTEGNGTENAEYIKIGKTILFKIDFTFGSTSAMPGSPTFTLPVTSVAITGASEKPIGYCQYFDTSGGVRNYGAVRQTSTTIGTLLVFRTDLTYLQLSAMSSTTPFTWATGDDIQIQGFYEAA